MFYRDLVKILNNYNNLSEENFKNYAAETHEVGSEHTSVAKDKMAILIIILRAWVLNNLENDEL